MSSYIARNFGKLIPEEMKKDILVVPLDTKNEGVEIKSTYVLETDANELTKEMIEKLQCEK